MHGTEEHPDVARILSNMGTVLDRQGRYKEARTHFERSLAIRLKVHGTEEHPDVAQTRRDLQNLRVSQLLLFLCAALLLLLCSVCSSVVLNLLMPFENRNEL